MSESERPPWKEVEKMSAQLFARGGIFVDDEGLDFVIGGAEADKVERTAMDEGGANRSRGVSAVLSIAQLRWAFERALLVVPQP